MIERSLLRSLFVFLFVFLFLFFDHDDSDIAKSPSLLSVLLLGLSSDDEDEVETSLLVGSSSPPVSSMYRSKSYPSMSASKKSNPIIELDAVSSDANKSVTAVVGDAPPSLPPPTIFIIICCDMVVVEEGAEVEMDVDVEMGSDPVVLDDQRVG